MPRTPTWERRSSTDAELVVAAALARQGWRILAQEHPRASASSRIWSRAKGATLALHRGQGALGSAAATSAPCRASSRWRKRRALRRGADVVSLMQNCALPELHTVRFDLAVVHRGGIAYYVAFM